IEAIGEIRVWIAQKGPVLVVDYGVAVDVPIAESAHGHIVLVYCIGTAGSRHGGGIGLVDLILGVPEPLDLIPEEFTYGMALGISDDGTAIETPALKIKVLDPIGDFFDLVVIGGKGHRGIEPEIIAQVE